MNGLLHVRPLLAVLVLGACTTGMNAAPAMERPAPELARDAEVTRVAADMPSGDYTLDASHSSVHWRVRHWGLSPYTGRFEAESGALSFNAADPTQSTLTVRIPVASVSTGHRTRDGQSVFDPGIANLLGGDGNPEIVFTSTSIEQISATTGRIHGDLSFNGQTHPVTLDAVFEGGRIIPTSRRPTLGFTARTIIQRSQWLGVRSSLQGNAGEEVEIIISAEFYRPAEEQPQG